MSLPRIAPNDLIQISGRDAIEMITRVAAKLQSRTKAQHSNTEQSVTDMLHRELSAFKKASSFNDFTESQIEWMRKELIILAEAGGIISLIEAVKEWKADVLIEEFFYNLPNKRIPTSLEIENA